ncbi:hypothetical protein ABS71_10715 [bacterium SCN 62-11]|nr:hypothetical protein [Candidatus Eremiobacteraeota bacterium]ODT67521.1 MAG: hypothetical protein ABS71_10715 [bacterium SCN 62-11]
MRRSRGFTLLETTLATALLCGLMLFLFNLYPASAMAIRQSQDQMTADTVAESLFSDYKAASFASLAPGKAALAKVVYSGCEYYPECEIYPVGSDPDLLKGVRVTVRWQTPRGPRSEKYELVLANLDS